MAIPSKNIIAEQRKRFQTYLLIDSFTSMITPFDFFSKEAFEIFNYALYLFVELEAKNFSYNFFFSSCLKKSIVYKDILESLIKKDKNLELFNTKLENKLNDSTFSKNLNIYNLFSKNNYSFINIFVKKLILNAKTRFKTPLISQELLIITLLEEINKTNKNLWTPNNFYTSRYQLLKQLYQFEANIKLSIPKNYLYFSYLLKMYLSNNEYERLHTMFKDQQGVLYFRNRLILKSLKYNVGKFLKKSIYKKFSH